MGPNLRFFPMCLFLILFLMIAGCAGLPATGIVITSDPPGAHISCNEGYLGQTPLTATIPDIPGAGSTYMIKAEKKGYVTATKVFVERGLEYAGNCIPKAIYFQLEEDKTVK